MVPPTSQGVETSALASRVIVCFEDVNKLSTLKDAANKDETAATENLAATQENARQVQAAADRDLAAADRDLASTHEVARRAKAAADRDLAAADRDLAAAHEDVASAHKVARRAKAAADRDLAAAHNVVLEAELILQCVKAAIGHDRNLFPTEYDTILSANCDNINIRFVCNVTSIAEYTTEKALSKLDYAEARLSKAKSELRDVINAPSLAAEEAKEKVAKSMLAREEAIAKSTLAVDEAKEKVAKSMSAREEAIAKSTLAVDEAKEKLAKSTLVREEAGSNVTESNGLFLGAKETLQQRLHSICIKDTSFFEMKSKECRLTQRLPFGMLGRENSFAEIKNCTLRPHDKYPPIMLISTSRAGKSLMLDTLKEKFNGKEEGDGSVFVVTCSLNGTQKTADVFEIPKCKDMDAPQFILFVLNLLLLGSIGEKPVNANWESLILIDSVRLCSLVRKRHRLKPETKLLFALDELTTIFDKFGESGQQYIVSELGYLSNQDSQLIVTGFTANAEKKFLGVSKRQPTLVKLSAIGTEDRYHYIPLMTALLSKIDRNFNGNSNDLIYFYGVAHEMLKSSPGLMGSIVEKLGSSELCLSNKRASLRNVVCQLRDLIPDRLHFKVDILGPGLHALNVYLTSAIETQQTVSLAEMMRLNMAAPGRLDVFRIVMAFEAWRDGLAKSGVDVLPAVSALPAVEVLYEFVDCYDKLYSKWGERLSTKLFKTFDTVKGGFFEAACLYGLRLLWLQMRSGRVMPSLLSGFADPTFFGDLKVVDFCEHFPVNTMSKPVEVFNKMFTPNTLLYPVGKNGKSENNPLVDLVLNMPTKTGLVQVWVQVKHTLSIKRLPVWKIRNAMKVVDKYNAEAFRSNQSDRVERVLFLFVGPSRLELEVVDDSGGKKVVRGSFSTRGGASGDSANKMVRVDRVDYCLPLGSNMKNTPLTIRCVTSPEERETLLGEFIYQLVPDFESWDSLLGVSLEEKVTTKSALNRATLEKLKCSKRDRIKELLSSDDMMKDFDSKRKVLEKQENEFFSSNGIIQPEEVEPIFGNNSGYD